MSDKMPFQADVSKFLDIVINSLYTDKQIFLRELISNASDACDKLKYMALIKPEYAAAAKDFKISLSADAKENTLTVADNGIGMNKADLLKHLGTIAKSGTAEFVKNVADNGSNVDLIGQFGVGFYSAFMVADKVEVLTKKAGEDKAWLWVSDGKSGFEVREAQKETNGTAIKLFLKKDQKNWTDTIFLRSTVKTYSDHISYPIVLCLGKDGEETVNAGSALWAKPKAEITDEQYKDFYQHLTHNFDNPWLTLHFKAEGNSEYTGLLYIPSVAPYDLFQPDKKNGLKLYVNKVFISDKVEGLLPTYLRFVKGVADSSDLPLNISREMLQKSPMLEKINAGITNRLLKELKKRAKNAEDYEKFWVAFGMAFKEGIYEDVKNRTDVAELSRFKSTNSAEKWTSLDEYITRAQKGQKEIYYITGDDVKVLANNPQLEAFKSKGLEVLLLTDPIDEFWTQMLTKYKDFEIKHISQAKLDMKEERKGAKAKEENLKKLQEFMATMFKDEVSKVEPTEKLTDSPAGLTVESGMMSLHLERLMRNHQQQTAFASSRILEINPYHPLIIKLSEMVTNEANKEKVTEVSKILLDQAKIAEGEPISDPSFFAKAVSEMVLKSL